MLVFAIDTANRRGGIAVARDGVILASRVLEPEDGFAGALFPAIRDLLAGLGLRPADIDRWAAASGPGSFTGIRVGLAAAKAMAEANGKLVAPVSLLEALSFAGEAELRAPVMDARRGEVYAALYDSRLEPLIEPCVGPFAEFVARIGDRESQFITNEETVFASDGPAPLPERARRLVAPIPAEAVALLGGLRPGTPPEAVEPLYIRPPDVREPG